MSTAATSEQPPFLSTHAFEQDIPPSIADGVAALLALDRQIIIVTGKTDGRMGGFLADLSHSISKRGSLLRIKSALAPEEFHTALAGQLNLPPRSEAPVQLAARIGHRLQQPAPIGRYVLVCEAADQYEVATLEAIRQISNYPVSIVLVGAHALTRRLGRRSLAPLRQRVTHQLALNRGGLFTTSFWIALAVLLAAGAGLLHLLASEPPTADAGLPRPISMKSAGPIHQPAPPPPAQTTPADPPVPAETPADPSELRLIWEADLTARSTADTDAGP